MNLDNFINKLINKYSFNLFAHSGLFLIFLTYCYILAGEIKSITYPTAIDTYYWNLLFFFPTIVYPLYVVIIILTTLILLAIERKNSNFFIKKDFVYAKFYKIPTIISFILSILIHGILCSFCVYIYLFI